MIRGYLDNEGTLTIEVDITIGTPQRPLKETNDELDFSSNVPLIIDSGAEVSIVPLDFILMNERSTPNGQRGRSASNHIMVAQKAGELPLNLPKEALTAHKMETNLALLSLREAVKHGCVVVFGYGENNDAIIYDQNNIEITVTGPPLVTGTIGRGGSWYVSDYAIPSANPVTEQQQSSPTASSSSSMLDLLPQGLRFDIYNMLSNKNKMVIFIVVVVLVLVARTGADANTAGAVKACRSLDTIF